jgi:hypothetical protein
MQKAVLKRKRTRKNTKNRTRKKTEYSPRQRVRKRQTKRRKKDKFVEQEDVKLGKKTERDKDEGEENGEYEALVYALKVEGLK